MLTLTNNTSYTAGVWVNQAIITDIKALEDRKDFNGKIYDFALEIDVVKDNNRKARFWIQGNLGKNDSWGGAYKIRDFFLTLGAFEGLTEELVKDKLFQFSNKIIPNDFLEFAIGKRLTILEFVNDLYEGKPSYRIWDVIRPADADKKEFTEFFEKEVTRRKLEGYPIPYKPELLGPVMENTTNTDNFPM